MIDVMVLFYVMMTDGYDYDLYGAFMVMTDGYGDNFSDGDAFMLCLLMVMARIDGLMMIMVTTDGYGADWCYGDDWCYDWCLWWLWL